MRYLPSVLAGIAAVALAGSMAMAAGNDLPLHHITVPLPDGGSVHVDYAGNVPPRVRVAPGPFDVAWPGLTHFGFGPSFADLQRISADIDREMNTLLREAKKGVAFPAIGAAHDLQTIDVGSLPPGSMSYSFVSSSNGRTTCSRSIEVTKPGNGGKPKVVTHSSGDCKGLPKIESGPANSNNSI